MKCFAGGAAVGLALLVTLTSGHATDSRSLSHVTIPSDQSLSPIGVRKLWHTTIPTSGARDYLVKVQLLGDTVVAQTDGGGLTALEAETGRVLWQTRFYGVQPGASVPAGANRNHILVIADGKLQALNRRTGARDWVINVPHLPATSVVATEHYAYYTAANGEVVSFKVPATLDQIRSADPGHLSTSGMVTKPEWSWGMRLTTSLDQEPVVVNGRLVIPQREGSVVSMSMDRAQVIDRFPRMGNLIAPVAVADNDLYFGTLSGMVHCVEVMREGVLERWRFACDGRITVRPLPVGNQLFVVSEDGALVCLNRTSGEQIWKRKNMKSLIAATQRNVLALDRQGQLVAFDRQYGIPLGQWNASQYSLPVLNSYSDRAYIANGNGMIVAMRDVTPAHNVPTVHFPPKPERPLEPRIELAEPVLGGPTRRPGDGNAAGVGAGGRVAPVGNQEAPTGPEKKDK